jgi:riboflavin kinase/FMN adenylyltransferase
MITPVKKIGRHVLATLSGTVEHGKGYGRTLGYPTVNIALSEEQKLREGVYAGSVILPNGSGFPAGIVITDEEGGKSRRAEAHLIGFSGDVYGTEVIFEVISFLRPYRKFDRQEDLIAQIGEDIKEVQRMVS